MISGIVMLVLGLIFWFGMAKNADEKGTSGFVRLWKHVFGAKGYLMTVRILAIFCLLVSFLEFYKYFTAG